MKGKIKYPVLSIGVEQGIIEWLKTESFNYKNWNLFWRELKNRYNNNYDKTRKSL
jgi:hypothetical protein